MKISNSQEEDSVILFKIINDAINELEINYKYLTDNGKLEALLFNYINAINTSSFENPGYSDKTKLNLLDKITNHIGNNYTISYNDYFLIVKNRIELYSNELDNFHNSEQNNFLMMETYTRFYISPCNLNSVTSNDIFEYMKFFPALIQMMNYVHKNTQEYYLLFHKNKNEKMIDDIESFIVNNEAFKYFSNNNTPLLIAYKKFEISLFSAAFHKHMLINNFGEETVQNEILEIKKVFYLKADIFYKEYIQNKSIKLGLLNSDDTNENTWKMNVFVKFNKYLDDITNLLKTKKIFWFEEWDKPEIDIEFGDILTGMRHFHGFIYSIFLSEISNDYEEKYIMRGEISYLEPQDLQMLQSFIDSLITIYYL